MITIKEALSLPELSGFRLVAGKAGLKKVIKTVGIFDYEQLDSIQDCFSPGDFVLTSLSLCHNDVVLMEKYLKEIINAGVCGIAIKEAFYKELPQGVIEVANNKGVAIFFYGMSVYSEDIIVAIREILSNDDKYLYYEKMIDNMTHLKYESDAKEDFYNFINPQRLTYMVGMYLKGKYVLEKGDLVKTLNELNYKIKMLLAEDDFSFFKYKNGILILYVCSSINQNRSFEELIDKLNLGKQEEKYFIGYDLKKRKVEDFIITIENSISAAQVCHLWQEKSLSYENIGIYKQILPLKEQSGIMEHYRNTLEIIKEYDDKHSSKLLETVIAFVNNNGEIGNTALDLKQHTNTVRYRMKKVEEILGWNTFKEASFYEQLFLDIKIYNLLNVIEKN